jgi:hypothetical protein
MRNARVSRIIACAAFATGGLLGGGGLLLSGASPASASTCPSTPGTLCINPNAGLVNHQTVMVVVRAAPHETIAVTECNAGVAGGDANACQESPSTLGKPGGPVLATTGGKGTARVKFKVLVSSTKAVGDGLCAPGGNGGAPCFLIAADISTMQPVANPTPFTTG